MSTSVNGTGTHPESIEASVPSEFAYPNGHLGHLTQVQEDALNKFRDLAQSQKLYAPAVDDQAPSHNDALLLRFLRARNFVPEDALKQFSETEHWRDINDIDNLYMDIDVDDYDESRRYYTHSIGRRGALDSTAMSTYAKSTAAIRLAERNETSEDTRKNSSGKLQEKTPPRLLRLFTICENFSGWMTQLCTALTDRPNPEVPITQSNSIVDISNIGIRQFWSLRSHLTDASALATAHYPETMDRIFVVGAPSFFPTVWSWVRRLFDPITVSKIFILSDQQAFATLSTYIEPENIPKRYGGSLDFEFGDLPTIDPAFADRITWKDDATSGVKDAQGKARRWPKGPVKWVTREDGNWDLLAVGSVEGKGRREVVATFTVGTELGGWADPSMRRSKPASAQ